MVLLTKRCAVECLYYLMSVEGEPNEKESAKFLELGGELDPDSFESYQDELITFCRNQMTMIFDPEDYYDVILEGVDTSLEGELVSDEDAITPRMLLWNLLIIASADEEYSNAERRLIKHIARKTGVSKDILLEMENLISTAAALEEELNWLQSSSKPYNEVAPVVADVETRIQTIADAAQSLIQDELGALSIEAMVITPDFVDQAKDKISETFAPVAEKIDEAVDPVKKAVAEKVTPIANDIGDKAGELVENIKGKLFAGLKSKKNSDD